MNIENCLIPSKYCGKSTVSIPTHNLKENVRYISKGTPLSCMQKGIGTGIYIEKRKSLPALSLQQIKYIGEQYENKFSKKNVKTITDLFKYIKTHSKTQNEKLLKDVLTMRNNTLDNKAYNSVIHYLYFSNEIPIIKLPMCKKI